MSQSQEDLELQEQLAMLGMDVGDVLGDVAKETKVEMSVPNPAQQVAEAQVVQPTQTTIVSQPTQPISTTPMNNKVVENNIPVKPVKEPATVTPEHVAPATQSDEIVFVDLARAVNTQKTPWLRLKDNERSRILIPDLRKAIPMKVHYLQGLGYFKCLSAYTPEGYLSSPAECCGKKDPITGKMVPRFDDNGNEIKAKNRYLLPVIEYPVDKNNHNSLIPGQVPQLKMWNMNAVEWNDLISAVQGCADNPEDLSTADLTNIDFALYKDTSSKFKTISISVTPKTFRPQFEAQIQAELVKLSDTEMYKDALKEARKILPIEVIVNNYNSQEALNNAVNDAIANSTMGNQDLGI